MSRLSLSAAAAAAEADHRTPRPRQSGQSFPVGGPPRPEGDWKPPGPWRRIVLAIMVVTASVVLARALPVSRDFSSSEIAGAVEVTSYELTVGQPIQFALPPGAQALRVLTNLDLAPGTPPEGIPYSVHVRVPEEGRDDTFPLMAVPATDQAGAATAFFLGRTGSPARTRVLALSRSTTMPATLEITLLIPGLEHPPRASVRVFVRHERVAKGSRPGLRDGKAPTAGVLAIEDLAPEVRDAFEAQLWSRLPTRVKTPTRGYYQVGVPAPIPHLGVERGEPVGDGHVAAFTVKGPGTLRIEAVEAPLKGRALVMDLSGAEKAHPLDLPVGGRQSLAVGRGLVTVRVAADAPARVKVIASSPAMATAPKQALPIDPTDKSEVEMSPAWSWQLLSRVGPGGISPIFTTVARGDLPLRVSARVRLGPTIGPGPGPTVPLQWRFLDGQGKVVSRGSAPIAGTAAPEDRIEGNDELIFVSEPTAFYLWPPKGAQQLVFEAERDLGVSVASPGFEPEPTDQAALKSVLLRYQHKERQPFYAVRPLNAMELRQAERVDRLRGAFRIEVRPPPELDLPASVTPSGDAGRFELLAPVTTPTAEDRPGLLWTLHRGRDESVTVPRPKGAGKNARVAATVLYEITHGGGRVALTISVDGAVVRRASVLSTRGQILLPPLPVGRHKLRVDLSAEGRLYIDKPVAGSGMFRRSKVYVMRPSGTPVPVFKDGAARALGVVLYTASPPPRNRPLEIEAIIDGGARRKRSAEMTRTFTQLRRRIVVSFQRVAGTTFLNRAGGELWTSIPIFVPLGDDLPRGGHLVALRTRGTGEPVMARFFSYGGRVASRINQHVELRGEVSE